MVLNKALFNAPLVCFGYEILGNKKGAYIAVSPFRIWCQWSDSNRHAFKGAGF